MPWTVFPDPERTRHRARDLRSTESAVAALLADTSRAVRHRHTDEMAAVSRLIRDAPHCVPCIMLLTRFDARGVYNAIERLKATIPVLLIHGPCTRCKRTTTAHTIGRGAQKPSPPDGQ
jgi:hypothetical protein